MEIKSGNVQSNLATVGTLRTSEQSRRVRPPSEAYNNNVKRDEIRTGSAGKREKWKKGNNGEGVINFAQSPPAAKLSFKI